MTTDAAHPPFLHPALQREYLLEHRVCPVGWLTAGILRVVAGPGALIEDAVEDLSHLYGCDVEVESLSGDEFHLLVERIVVGQAADVELQPADATDLDADARDLASQPPIIRFVNLLLADAHEAGASDIHLESTREGLATRLRIDGALVAGLECPAEYQTAVISRMKLLAELDIAERRRPQDGRIRVRLRSRELDVRVSTVPTLHGESVVLRLLDQGGRAVTLPELGMPTDVLHRVDALARRPHGMVLVTGPTGSGKTTTLYAALQLRDANHEKVVTVEDPVEYRLPGVTQVPVHRAAGVGFATALRAILRQDPDVVMIGEMRDGETADVAVQAAMTGHMVLSTLHTNDAVGAIPRLIDLGVPEYLVAATLDGVIAQRLVRRTCDACRVVYHPSRDLLAPFAACDQMPETFLRGAGCTVCRGTGFRGRVGVFELLIADDAIRGAIVRRASLQELSQLARAAGLQSLMFDGWRKVCAFQTTVEEVTRVLQIGAR